MKHAPIAKNIERTAAARIARNAAELSAKNEQRIHLRSRIDLADAPSGGGGAVGYAGAEGVDDGGGATGEGLIGGIVGAAAGAGGRFVADDGTRYMVVKSSPPPPTPPEPPEPPTARVLAKLARKRRGSGG